MKKITLLLFIWIALAMLAKAHATDITQREIDESAINNVEMTGVTMEQAHKIVLSACILQHGAIISEGAHTMACAYKLTHLTVVYYTLIQSRHGVLTAWVCNDELIGNVSGINLRRVYAHIKAKYITK